MSFPSVPRSVATVMMGPEEFSADGAQVTAVPLNISKHKFAKLYVIAGLMATAAQTITVRVKGSTTPDGSYTNLADADLIVLYKDGVKGNAFTIKGTDDNTVAVIELVPLYATHSYIKVELTIADASSGSTLISVLGTVDTPRT